MLCLTCILKVSAFLCFAQTGCFTNDLGRSFSEYRGPEERRCTPQPAGCPGRGWECFFGVTATESATELRHSATPRSLCLTSYRLETSRLGDALPCLGPAEHFTSP